MYKPTIGLEIHVELKTNTKMFCACDNNPFITEPNINVCPICLGHPGALPTINKDAILAVIKVGLALQGDIREKSHFDRKSYFYPDLPKGYQISQYEEPLVEGGNLKGVRIKRIHLEEDTGTLIHSNDNATLVDFNRAGVPLMELVTEPDIKTPGQAVEFARELKRVLKYLDVSDADMEKGHMRLEANISISSTDQLGTKVEVKNLNSFRALEGAIAHELKRQEEILSKGEKIVQETRGWDESKRVTVSQRSKESAHDYRYFPEPDLPPMDLSDWDLDKIRNEIPELPEQKFSRFMNEYNCSDEHSTMLTEEKHIADYFEASASELKSMVPTTNFKLLANYYTSDLFGLIKEKALKLNELKITPEHFAHLIALIEKGELSSRLAKDLLLKMYDRGEDPETLMKESGVNIIEGVEELQAIVDEIIGENPNIVADYKKGKGSVIQFFVGLGMAKTKGQANPTILKNLFEKALGV